MLRRTIAVSVALLLAVACSSSESGGGATASGDGGVTNEGGSTRPDSGGTGTGDDGGSGGGSLCAKTRAYVERCGGDGALNCGTDGFDAWCAANDQAVNSEAYRRAEEKCLTADLACDAKARRDCEYRSYNGETPTAAQSAVVDAYCSTCEPGDVAGCKTRSTTYDPAAGPGSVGDIFIAAWELRDAIVDAIRTKCTGAALDGGADSAACAKAFADCAAEPYLDAVPDCPK
jgi:hypothetical protein